MRITCLFIKQKYKAFEKNLLGKVLFVKWLSSWGRSTEAFKLWTPIWVTKVALKYVLRNTFSHTFEKLSPIIQVVEENCGAALKEVYLEWLVGNPLIELTLENKHVVKACREAACLFFTSFPSCLFFFLIKSSSFLLQVVTVTQLLLSSTKNSKPTPQTFTD